MKRTIAIYAVALTTALGFAYRTWTHEGDPDLSKAVVVLAGDVDDLESVEYSSDKVTVTLTVKQDELGRYYWVRAEPKEQPEEEPEESGDDPEASDPHKPKPKPKAEVDTEVVEFKAGKAGDSVVKGMAPFVAKRTLQGIDDSKLEELGLADSTTTLTIRRRGREPKTYELGTNVYGGSNVYVRDPENGKIHLVEARLVRPLQNGKRTLPDRTMLGLQIKQIKQVEVFGGEATASFEQHNADDPAAMFWSVTGEQESNPTAAGWLDKALRLRSSRYIQPDQEPAQLEEAFRFTASSAGDAKKVSVTVYRGMGDDGEENWYARSNHTRSLVALHRSSAAETAADIASVLDAGQG